VLHSIAFLGISAGGGGVNIDFDLTFTLQMLLFVVLIVALKPTLFDPLLKVFEAREARTEGAKDSAREMQRQAGELLKRYESELQRVNVAAAEERDKIRAETTRLEGEILGKARAASALVLESGRKEIERQVQQIRFELGRRSEVLGREVAARALGRDVQ
jgi:F-type H+-transporting ATPase subunit b